MTEASLAHGTRGRNSEDKPGFEDSFLSLNQTHTHTHTTLGAGGPASGIINDIERHLISREQTEVRIKRNEPLHSNKT